MRAAISSTVYDFSGYIELDLLPMIKAKVDGVPVFDAHYGTSNGKYAIRIDRLLTGSQAGWLGEQSV